MKLKRGGSVFDVTHPSEIARLKRAGFVEVTDETFAAEQQVIVESAIGKGQVAAEKSLDKMTVNELKALAEKVGVEGFETMKKAELVAALKQGGEE